jgi:hypothetical protein
VRFVALAFEPFVEHRVAVATTAPIQVENGEFQKWPQERQGRNCVPVQNAHPDLAQVTAALVVAVVAIGHRGF